MPNYTVLCRGGLALTSKLDDKKPQGSIVQLSEEDAASLPPGTVALGTVDVDDKKAPKLKKPVEEKKPAPEKK